MDYTKAKKAEVGKLICNAVYSLLRLWLVFLQCPKFLNGIDVTIKWVILYRGDTMVDEEEY